MVWLSSNSVCGLIVNPILFVVWLSIQFCLPVVCHPVLFACGLIVIQFCLPVVCHPILFVICQPVLFACGLIVIQLFACGLIAIQFCLWFECHPVLFACCLIVIQYCLSVVWLPSNSVFRLPAVRQVLWHHGEEVWSTRKGNHCLWWLHSVLCCASGKRFSSVVSSPWA